MLINLICINFLTFLTFGYRFPCRADNAAYTHDCRADKRRYRHDRRADSQCPPQIGPGDSRFRIHRGSDHFCVTTRNIYISPYSIKLFLRRYGSYSLCLLNFNLCTLFNEDVNINVDYFHGLRMFAANKKVFKLFF